MQAQMQKQVEIGSPIEELDSKPRWPFAKRIAFRFVFAYFVLYIIPFPLDIIPFIAQKYNEFWQAIVPWVGKHLLRLSYDITVFQNGSGDTTFNYVQALCFLTLAALATVIWSSLDRRRLNYNQAYASFTFEELDPELITLEGEMDGHKTSAKLSRFDESKFLLTNRGFHWIQEYPFNR